MSKDNNDKKSILQREISTKEALILLGITGFIAIYGFIFIYPKYTTYKTARYNLDSIQSEISTYEGKIDNMPNLQNNLISFKKERDLKSKELSHNMEDGMFLIGLSKVLDDCDVNLVSYNVEETIQYETFYSIPTTIELIGDYNDVKEVMHYMETQKNVTQILDYSMDTYIEEKESNETDNNTTLPESKTIDKVVYWVSSSQSDLYHKANCGVLQGELSANGGQQISEGSYTDSKKANPCEVCRPYTVDTVSNQSEVNTEVEDEKATGKVSAKFKFIMYSNENPTLNLNNDDSSKWKPGKHNPFKTTSR